MNHSSHTMVHTFSMMNPTEPYTLPDTINLCHDISAQTKCKTLLPNFIEHSRHPKTNTTKPSLQRVQKVHEQALRLSNEREVPNETNPRWSSGSWIPHYDRGQASIHMDSAIRSTPQKGTPCHAR
jgi:hypothetical protein